MQKPRILFIVDVRNWAFDFRALKWKELLKSKYHIDISYLKDYEQKKFPSFNSLNYNGYVFFFYKASASSVFSGQNILYDKTAVCVNSEKWRRDGMEYTYQKYLKNFKLIIGCNDNIISEFSKYSLPLIKVTQCVDENIFYPMIKKERKNIRIGWCGNRETKEKNIDYLISACYEIPQISLDIKNNLNQKELNIWYNTLDMVVCVSEIEGGPNLLLEAGACKIPIITTPCGISNELIIHEKTGLFVPHNRIDILIKTIKNLAVNKSLSEFLSNNMYTEIINKWTYQKKLYEIETAIQKLLT